jgi:hypothetical protein
MGAASSVSIDPLWVFYGYSLAPGCIRLLFPLPPHAVKSYHVLDPPPPQGVTKLVLLIRTLCVCAVK